MVLTLGPYFVLLSRLHESNAAFVKFVAGIAAFGATWTAQLLWRRAVWWWKRRTASLNEVRIRGFDGEEREGEKQRKSSEVEGQLHVGELGQDGSEKRIISMQPVSTVFFF